MEKRVCENKLMISCKLLRRSTTVGRFSEPYGKHCSYAKKILLRCQVNEIIKRLLLMLLYAPLCFLCACSFSRNGDDTNGKSEEIINTQEIVYQKITSDQAKTIMDGNEPYILLDVRTDEEFQENHIEGAVLIPDYEINERAESELPDKDALILIYCRSGRRSALAAKELIDMGYTNVFDFGGITDWPYETTGE